jgi:(E)-4-hydroxy-3-methylbut-2-enyl-diphosphate synthase
MPRLRPHRLDHVPELARSIQDFIGVEMPGWKTRYPGVNRSTSRSWAVSSTAPAIQACRHRHLARHRRNPAAPVTVDGKKFRTLRGPNIATEFKAMVIDYIDQRYGAGANPGKHGTAAEK